MVTKNKTEEPDETEFLLTELQKKLIGHARNKKEYTKIAEKILRLRELRQRTMKDNRIKEEHLQRIHELRKFICEQALNN